MTGELRYKRRFKWSAQAFIIGTLFGMLLMIVF